MAFIKLQFKPGVNRDQTDYSNEGGWYACDKIRFRSGYPEKIGGWQKATPAAFVGVCRQMYNWATTFGDNFVSLGTNEKLYIENGGNFFDVTPIRATMTTPNTDNCINTTNGSTTVVVNLGAPHGALTGSYVQISGAAGASIGGIPIAQINTNHKITVIDADSFSFVVSTAATSTVSNAGGTAVVIAFEITPGNAVTVKGTGWGAGTWGRNSWGLGSTTGGINLPQRDWWFDNFDNDLAMNIRDGAAYWWERGSNSNPASALATRAISLSAYATAEGFDANAVPAKIMQLLVSQQDRHLIAFGAVPFGSTNPADFDPMLIRWADQDTPADWTPTNTNSAGDIRVSRGSKIVRALPTRQEVLVWTDAALYTLQFLGTTDVFGLQEYADNISIASPRAVATAANVTYWMGRDKFYAYTGRVETVPCTLRNYVFKNINFTQADQIICSTNEEWNEIWWFYPTADSFYNNAYVVYNHLERVWYYGSIDRTAWLDSPLREYPLAANSPVSVQGTSTVVGSGYMYEHERGVDADGSPMSSFIESSDFDLEDGDQFMLISRLVPDITFNGSTAVAPEVTFRITPRNFPGAAVYTDSNDTQRVVETVVGQFTPQVFIRARARQMALKVMSENLGVQWQLGAPRLDARSDGRRA